MIFQDREDAGRRLASELQEYLHRKDAIVVGLARGGVVVAQALADALGLPWDVMIVRKIGAPSNPELAVGAIAENGAPVFNSDIVAHLGVSPEYLAREVAEQKAVAATRAAAYRGKKKPPSFQGKTVIVVDDGIATGATMHAAIQAAKAQGAKKVVLAVPVAPAESLKEFVGEADRIFCLSTPAVFYAVGQFYTDFGQVDDAEIVRRMHATGIEVRDGKKAN